MKLNRKNITMMILSKFIENNMEKIENVSTKANNITFMTTEGTKKVKVRTSTNYNEDGDGNTYLWTSLSKEEVYESDYDYIVLVCKEDIEKALVFTIEELKEHFSLEQKKKKNGEVDYEMYPNFIGRKSFDARVRANQERIDITRYVNNYTF